MTNTRRGRSRLRRRLAALAAGAAALALVVAGATPAQAVTGDVRTHDPSVIVSGDCYYAYSTGLGGGPGNGSIQIRRSCGNGGHRGWTFVGTMFGSVPSWITQRLGQTPPSLWAPDIDYVNGQYRLYYAASIWGQTKLAVVGLATASNPAGPWTDRGQVTDQHYAIDPNLVVSGSSQYLTYGGFPGIWVQPVNTSTGIVTGTATQLATKIENSSIVSNGGYYYLLGSKGKCCAGTSSNYYTVVGRSTSLTGPFKDKSGVDLMSGGGSTVLDSGGGDFFTDAGGLKFAYHYYDPQNNGQEHLDIRPVSFSGGWPVFGNPIGD